MFANRLFTNVKATITKQEFDNSYQAAQKIKRRIKKIPYLDKLEKRSVERGVYTSGSVKYDSIFDV